MAAGRALVDAFRQRAHLGDALGDLLAEQHAAAAGLGALADHDLDGVGLAQIVRVHAVARGQHLIDQDLRMLALLRRHAAVAGGGRGAGERWRRGRAPPWPGADSEPKLMPAMVIGIFSSIGFLAKRVPSIDVGRAFLAIAFERIAADRGAEEQQIVEMRQLALGAAAADVVDAGRRGAADFGDACSRRRSRTCAAACGSSGPAALISRRPALSMWKW